MADADCYSCGDEGRFDSLPPRALIAADEYWRVAHAFGTSLPGWLVLLPRRHVTAIADVTDAEAAGLGLWQVRLSRALHQATGCLKTYVAQFAETEGFGHVHFHVVPRMPDWPEELRGPKVFGLIGQPAELALSADQMDKMALKVRDHLGSAEP